jgi:Ca-activated chloride channel homolog
VKRSFAPGRLNIVVLLTDGINDDPDGGIDQRTLLTRLKAEQGDRPVQIVTIAFGANADIAALNKISQATGGRAFAARDPRDIERVFTDVISQLPVG